MESGFYLWASPLASVEELLRDIEPQLRREQRKRGRKLSGKASAAPWQKLKWLAALRLAKAGKSYEKARDHIREHQANSVIRNDAVTPQEILPIYESSGAWSDAVNAARQLVGGTR
jgi:hypothetical protein